MQTISIGRDSSNDIILNDQSVSRKHAQLVREPDGRILIKDLDSSNGTFVNGNRISEQFLNAGDIVACGTLNLNWSIVFPENQPIDKSLNQKPDLPPPKNQIPISTKPILAVTFILTGNILLIYNNIGSGWTSTITAIIGFILFFIGLDRLKSFLDNQGKSGIKLLIIAAILGIISLILDNIPLIGGLIAGLINLTTFVVQIVGLLRLKKSETLGKTGTEGATILLISMVLIVFGSMLSYTPFMGDMIKSGTFLVAFVLILFGWLKIQKAIIDRIFPNKPAITN